MNKTLIATIAAAALLAGPVLAQQPTAPGQMMKDNDKGASKNAPGQKMLDKGSVSGSPGASGYAPGHADTKTKSGTTTGKGTASDGTSRSGSR